MVAGDVGSSFGNPAFTVAAPSTTAGMTDFRPTAGSPLIDSGDPTRTPAVDEIDLLGNARRNGSRVDRGTIEW